MAQWNKNNQDYLNQERTLHEVYLQADQYGTILNEGASYRSAFGEPLAIPITPVIQLDGLYGIDPLVFETYSFSTGIVTTSTLMQVESGTGAYGYGVIRSRRTVRYRPGQGALARFTAKFDEGITGYTQRAGFFTQEQAVQVGFHTTGQFGVLRENGGKAHVHKFTVGTPAGGAEDLTFTLNGSDTVISIDETTTSGSVTAIGNSSFPGWTVDYSGNDIYFLSNSVGPNVGSFSVSSTGALVAASTTSQSGINHTSNWTYQNDWNIDTLTGVGGTSNPSGVTINPQSLNVYQINFRWLGAGEIRYAVENPDNGDMIYFHHEHYSNRNDDVHLDNPSLKIGYVAASLQPTTGAGVTVCGASMMGAIEGIINPISYPIAASHSRGSMSTGSIYHLLTIKGNLIANNKINTREILVKKISAGVRVTTGSSPAFVYLYIDAVTAADLEFTNIGRSSSYSDTETTIVSGEPIAVFSVTSGAPDTIDLEDLRIALPPQSKLTMAVSSSANLQAGDASIIFVED